MGLLFRNSKGKALRLYLPGIALAFCFLLLAIPVAGQGQKSDIGNFYPLLQAHAEQQNRQLAYEYKGRKSDKKWRRQARAKLTELLAYQPAPVPLQSEIRSKTQRDGYTQYLVRYHVTALQITEAFLLIPDNLTKPAPAVIALHDHGGFYFFGKEKQTYTDDQPELLKEYIANLYEGQTYADELARRGYVVLSPDAPYFGSQKLDPSQVSESLTKAYTAQLTANKDASIKAYNKFANGQEVAMNKTILASGTTWLGMLVHSDRVAIDFLLTRPEVDPERIASMGLSLGGLRSTYLFGLDARIKAGVVSAFSTTYAHMLQSHARHTWMLYVPRQYLYLDLPDVASLNAPRPLLVQNCRQDKLFSLAGMQAAEVDLKDVYTRMKAPENFTCTYYDVPHSMPRAMQQEAFDWLEQKLKK